MFAKRSHVKSTKKYYVLHVKTVNVKIGFISIFSHIRHTPGKTKFSDQNVQCARTN